MNQGSLFSRPETDLEFLRNQEQTVRPMVGYTSLCEATDGEVLITAPSESSV